MHGEHEAAGQGCIFLIVFKKEFVHVDQAAQGPGTDPVRCGSLQPEELEKPSEEDGDQTWLPSSACFTLRCIRLDPVKKPLIP